MSKVCVVTGTRAEYSLLCGLMQALRDDDSFELQIVATGMHLSPEFGLTVERFASDGLDVNRKVEMLLSSDTPTGIAKSTGLGMIGFADAFADLCPELIVVLGDRFEILAAVTAALYARIPIAHIHGGETTLGAFDEGIRHAITKMSHLHFVAAEDYRRRVVQLGENPEHVYNVGGLGVDAIRQTELLSQEALNTLVGMSIGNRCLLVTFHPVTLEHATAEEQYGELLAALRGIVHECQIVFTMPNADTDGRQLIQMTRQFAAEYPESTRAVTSLGQPGYWSMLSQAAAVIGNSSSGLLEAPSFGVPTVNIGDRQTGRLKAASVLDCPPSATEITGAIRKALSDEFRDTCASVISPYGSGGAARKIVEILRGFEPGQQIVKKSFYDVAVDIEDAGAHESEQQIEA